MLGRCLLNKISGGALDTVLMLTFQKSIRRLSKKSIRSTQVKRKGTNGYVEAVQVRLKVLALLL